MPIAYAFKNLQSWEFHSNPQICLCKVLLYYVLSLSIYLWESILSSRTNVKFVGLRIVVETVLPGLISFCSALVLTSSWPWGIA